MLLERQRHILDIIRQSEYANVKDLSETFQVSESTIRTDLIRLGEAGLIERVHGGARRIETAGVDSVYHAQVKIRIQEKKQIAAAAAELVQDGSVIGLDGGSTVFQLARCLAGRKITVVTNSVYSALELVQHHPTRVVLIGGEFDPKLGCIIGNLGEPMLDGPTGLKTKQYFTSPGGLTVEAGLMDLDPDENRIKKLMIAAAEQVIVLADHSKIGTTALLPYAPISAVGHIITDNKADPEYVERLQKAGAKVIIAE